MLLPLKITSKIIFDYFQGKWQIERYFSNYNYMHGQAEFLQRNNNELYYTEHGNVILPLNKTYTATQYYIYQLKDDSILKLFINTGLFYKLSFNNKLAYGYHKCVHDSYFAEYSFIKNDFFSLKYIIKGPKKDLVIITNFSR